MSERMKNRQEPDTRVGVRKTLVPRGSILKRMMLVAGIAVAGVLGWAGKGKADTFEDYVASFNDPGNRRSMPSEINRPGVLGLDSCAFSPDGTLFRWREVVSRTDRSIKEVPIIINADGTLSTNGPIRTLYGPDDMNYFDTFITSSGNEFLNRGTSILLRNGTEILNRSMAIDGFDFGDTTPYPFGPSIALDFNDGEVRSGLTPDTGDIGIFPENYSGPPIPVITNADFLANVIPIRELSPDPADPAEALIQIRAIFGHLTRHAFVTEFCRRGPGDCIRTPDQTTWDIFAYEYDEIRGSWIPESKTKVASTSIGYDRASCVLDDERGEWLVMDGRRFDYVFLCKDPDNDRVDNCRGDNCPIDANADQNDRDRDDRGDVCDPCPDDPTNDRDGDDVCQDIDNCLEVSNPGQEDTDLDGGGDACDPCPRDAMNDVDGDGICGDIDNCPTVFNPGQENTCGGEAGDACEVCPPVDAGVDGGRDATMEVGVDGGSDAVDSGVDANADGNVDVGGDAMIDVDSGQKDSGGDRTDAEMGTDSSDVRNSEDGNDDTVNGNTDVHDGGRTEISNPPPHKPGCACSIHGKESPLGIAGKIGFMIGLATARILRRRKMLSRNSR